MSGQIVDRGDPTGPNGLSGANIPQTKAVAGVQVEVFPTGGVAVDRSSEVATTGADGWWTVTFSARDTGSVTADIVVTAPGSAGYRVRGVTLRASNIRGNGNVVGRWTHQLYLTKIGEVITSPSGVRPEGARVTAIRSGGIAIAPTRNTTSPMFTLAGGRFVYDVRPLADGPLIVDFVIERAGLPTATVRNVSLAPMHEWVPPNVDGAVIFYLDSAGNRVGG